MKVLIAIFYLSISINVFAQSSVPFNKTSAIGEHNPLYIIDDRVIENPLTNDVMKDSNSTDILSISIFKDPEKTKLYGDKGKNGVVFITTKVYAIKQYQLKLSAFSREYESYLKSHDNKDEDIQYVVHNDPLEKQEVTNFLYNLPPEKIIGVTFTEQPGLNANSTQKVVIIETKVGE